MATLRRLARRSLGDLRDRPVAIVHGALVVLAGVLLPLAVGLGYLWLTRFRGGLLLAGFVAVQVLALAPVALADLVVVRGLTAPESTTVCACRAVGRRWRATLPWALLSTVWLVPILGNPLGGPLVTVVAGLASPVLFLAPAALVLVLTVPYALTLAVPVVVAGGHEELAGGLREGAGVQWRLLRRAPGTTVGVAVLAAAPLAVAGVLVAVGTTLTLVGLAMGWLVAPLVLVVLGLPILLLGLVVLPVAYVYARALAVRTVVTELTDRPDAESPGEPAGRPDDDSPGESTDQRDLGPPAERDLGPPAERVP